MTSKGIEQNFPNPGELPLAIIMSSMLPSPQERSFSSVRYHLSFILLLLVAGCESTPHRAPVIDSAAVESQEGKMGGDAEAAGRSEFHTVQKGIRSTVLRVAVVLIKRIWRSGITSRILALSMSVNNLRYLRHPACHNPPCSHFLSRCRHLQP